MKSQGLLVCCGLSNFLVPSIQIFSFLCWADLHVAPRGCRPWSTILCWSQIKPSLLKTLCFRSTQQNSFCHLVSTHYVPSLSLFHVLPYLITLGSGSSSTPELERRKPKVRDVHFRVKFSWPWSSWSFHYPLSLQKVRKFRQFSN